jgi:hypothetical protein
MWDGCESTVFEVVVVCGVSECVGRRGLYLGYHPKLPVMWKVKPNSGETPG